MKVRPLKKSLIGCLFFFGATLMMCGEVRAETTEKVFEIYGFGMLDYVQDFNRVDPAWADTLRPSRIPTAEGTFGRDGQAVLSVRQSRFGVQANLPVQDRDFFTKFEFDLFGVGVDEGQTTIRLRHAYGEWGQWLAGQTHSLFMDVDVFPNILDYWGPSGMVFFRHPQIRWTPMKGNTSMAVAIENPVNDIDPGNIRELAPELGANIQPQTKLPDLTAMYRLSGDWGHFQASGILRYLGFETLGTPGNAPRNNKTGWGVDLSTKVKVLTNDRVILSAVFGQGIASYMNDGGVDLAPEGQPGDLSAKAVPLFGVNAYYEHAWNDLWTSAIGYSQTQVDNTDFQTSSAFKRGQYASANALYAPTKNLLSGLEVLWGGRTDKDGADGTDIRTQLSMKYSFSSKDF